MSDQRKRAVKNTHLVSVQPNYRVIAWMQVPQTQNNVSRSEFPNALMIGDT